MKCGAHYSDYGCIGPTEDEEYKIVDNILLGTRIQPVSKMIGGNQTLSGQKALGLGTTIAVVAGDI